MSEIVAAIWSFRNIMVIIGGGGTILAVMIKYGILSKFTGDPKITKSEADDRYVNKTEGAELVTYDSLDAKKLLSEHEHELTCRAKTAELVNDIKEEIRSGFDKTTQAVEAKLTRSDEKNERRFSEVFSVISKIKE